MRQLFVHAVVPLAVLLAACSTFDSLDRGVCGNGLIEPGEDCDSGDASCVRCSVTCDARSDCPTTAYSCGVDGLCHAPGGTLAPAAPAGPFQVNDFAITDIGGDGTGDVLGLSRTSIVVKRGDTTGQLGTAASIVTPFQTGRPAFGDLDGDGSLDITMTTPDGLVSYTSPLGELTPLPVQSSLGGAGGPFELVGLYRVSNFSLGGWLSSTANDALLLAVFDMSSSANDAVVLPCGQMFKASAFTEGMADVYRLSADTDAATDVMVALTAPLLSGQVRTCVMTINKTQNTPAVVGDATPVAAVAGMVGKPVLADVDLDADKCPSLLAFNQQGALRNFKGTRGATTCTLAATSNPLVLTNATPGATLITHFPLVPQIALVAPDAVVLSDGVYANTVIGPQKVYTSPRKIARADYGDLNGDGIVDGVVASEGEDDIDLLYRTQNPGYQLVRLDTASRVTSLTVGDYDGNGIEDIAYTELLDQYQRLEVSFSTTDRPLDPVTVGAFPNNISTIRLSVPDSLDPQGLAADLAVLTLKTGTRPATVTLLHGSSQRTMLPYYDPIPDSTGIDKRKTHQMRGAVVGKFAGDDALLDVVGIGVPMPHLDNTATTPIKAWAMKGTPLGPDGTASAGKPIAGIVDCSKTTPGATDLCADDLLYVPIAAGSHDVVLAIDKSDPPRSSVADPTTVNAMLPLAASVLTNGLARGTTVRSAYARDLDGDGSLEVVASFAPRMQGGKGAIIKCGFSGTAPKDCADLAPAIVAKVDGADVCVDAAPGKVDYVDPFTAPDTVRSAELIVLCRGGGVSMLERVVLGASGPEVTELARVPGILEALRVGDVTGDGIDDIAALANDHGAGTLEVFRQCSSRDVSACRGGGGK